MNALNKLVGLSLAAAGLAHGAILWDGRFNDLSSSADLNTWSWSNQVGPYQYYIHGSGPVTDYVNFDASYKNPADSGSTKGAKISLTSTAYWNGQTMRRTELIPQTSAAINSGKVYYHFSMMRSDTNAPSIFREHQIAFFESHFTEMKAGWISGEQATSDPLLRWDVSSNTQWSTNWTAGVWHNVAYEVDFAGGSVAFWHSTGGDALTRVVAPVAVGASSNGADWHLGVLELPRTGYSDTDEDIYFSGVYIENGSLTTSVSGPGGSTNPSSVSASTTASLTSRASSSSTMATSTKTTSSTKSSSSVSTKSSSSSTSTPMTTTAKTTTPATSGSSTSTASHWGQCGGSGYSGPTVCAAPYACSTLNPYYAQCL